MRILAIATMDTQIANELVRSGKIGEAIGPVMAAMKPEAAYFYEDKGVRTQCFILHVNDPSELPGVAEPWWQTFGGTIEFHPAMVQADLEKALSQMG